MNYIIIICRALGSINSLNKNMGFKDYLPELAIINKYVSKIRKNSPATFGTWKEPADIFVKKENLKGKVIEAINVTLTPSGCEWAKTGGCTMCGEWSGSNLGDKIDAQYHIAQFASAVANSISTHPYPWIRIYQEGSYMNPREVDVLAQKVILKLASSLKGVERITIEGKARYMTNDVVKLLKDAVIPPVELEVGIGFEAQDEIIRMVCVNKGEVMDQYKKAVKLLKDNGIKTLAYVLLKPSFLTEKEGIDEAVSTIKKAFEIGFDRVSLEPLSIHQWSLLEALYMNGVYQTPWLWSIIEVIKKTHDLGEIRIGGVEYFPRPDVVANNHHADNSECSVSILEAIKKYNYSRQIDIFDKLDCRCKKEWKKELTKTYPPLKERIGNYLAKISIDDYIQKKKKKTDKSKSLQSSSLNP